MKKLITLLLALTLLLSLAACKKTAGDGLVDGKIMAGYLEKTEVETCSFLDWVDKNANGGIPMPENYEYKTFSSVTQMLLELEAGRLSYIGGIPQCTAEYICKANPAYSYMTSSSDQYFKMAVAEESGELRDSLNTALEELAADGTLDALKAEYIDNVTAEPAKNELKHIDGAKTVKVGVTGDFPPFDYIAADGTPAGYNVALLSALSEKMNVSFELVPIEAAARTTALSAGTIDAVFWMVAYLDENSESAESGLLFTSSYFGSDNAIVTKDYPIESIKEIYGMK